MRALLLLPLALVACTNTFECGGKAPQSISQDRVCDGVVDCWGGQDESQAGCDTLVAWCGQPEPEAILASSICDGVEDCGDGLDEVDCP